ncbi:MAG: HDIG domain-containing protein [Myxococcota bacterium]
MGFVALLLAVSLALTIIISPSSSGEKYPVSPELIGKPAPRNIKAARSYKIPDMVTTEQKREEAVKGIKSVYDFDTVINQVIVNRIRNSYHLIRTVFDKFPDLMDKESAETPSGKGTEGTAFKKVEEEWRIRREREEELARNIEEKRGEFIKTLQIPPSEDEWKALVEARFSLDVENALIDIMNQILSGLIISDRKLLEPEKGKGITIVRRDENGNFEDEETISSVELIKDLAESQRYIHTVAYEQLPASFSQKLRKTLISIASRLIQPNLTFNYSETERRKEEARKEVKTVFISIEKGEMIVREGERLKEKDILILQEMSRLSREEDPFLSLIGLFLFSFFFIGLVTWFAHKNIRKFTRELKDLLFMSVILVGIIALCKAWVYAAEAIHEFYSETPIEMWYYVAPVMAGAMIVRFVLNSETAIVFSIIISVIFGIMMENQLAMTLFAFGGSIGGSAAVGQAQQRMTIIKAGIAAAVINVLTALVLKMTLTNEIHGHLLLISLGAFTAGILSAMLVSFFSMAVEDIFGYITNIKLLELANLNHPVLRELMMNAPGTYHHSIVVGSLAEGGAYAVGANPLLARVMAYYHDIGKTKASEFFAENQKGGNNPHKGKSPSLSASIIKGHVEEGLRLAKKYKLGKPIIDAITQHHGTSLISYFYNLALEEAKENPKDSNVDESLFRHKGPKPQTREAALIMIADGCEAAAKTLTNPDEARIRGVVQKKINALFTDGQFDECNITLKDLHLIANAYTKVLAAYYHSRPVYQEPAGKEKSVAEKERSSQKGQKSDSSPENGKNGQQKENSDAHQERRTTGQSQKIPAEKN